MKNTILIILLLSYSLTNAQIKARVSENNRKLTWIGKASVGNYAPQGTLEIMSGEIIYTSEEIQQLNLVINMKSLEQENTQLQNHLLEKDFFYVKKFPVATFVQTEAVKLENGYAIISGNMTIRGKTQTENIIIQINSNKDGVTITFEHKMDRTRYGVNHNSPSIFKKIKENAIADEFLLKGNIKFIE